MRIAITGSSGFIGSALRAALEADGHEVLRVVRTAGGPGTTRWDVERGEIDPAAFERLDGVVHLAGEGIGDKRWTDDQKRKILESRTKGTALLCEALASLNDQPPVLVSGSAIGYYGDRGNELLREDSASGSDFLSKDNMTNILAQSGVIAGVVPLIDQPKAAQAVRLEAFTERCVEKTAAAARTLLAEFGVANGLH